MVALLPMSPGLAKIVFHNHRLNSFFYFFNIYCGGAAGNKFNVV
jgi:hypothetical protein